VTEQDRDNRDQEQDRPAGGKSGTAGATEARSLGAQQDWERTGRGQPGSAGNPSDAAETGSPGDSSNGNSDGEEGGGPGTR